MKIKKSAESLFCEIKLNGSNACTATNGGKTQSQQVGKILVESEACDCHGLLSLRDGDVGVERRPNWRRRRVEKTKKRSTIFETIHR